MLHRARTLLLLTMAIVQSWGCHHSDPQTAFDRAWESFNSGDLVRAQEEAGAGYHEFHTTSADWAWKFTILRAEVLRRRGMYKEALSLLTSEPASEPPNDLAVERLWLEGVLQTTLHNYQDAEQDFTSAQGRCVGSTRIACQDVASGRGALEMERGHFADAQVVFEGVLRMARANDDPVGEADALLDLSHSADEQAHFDEALDWATAARRLALTQHFESVAQKALGNMGWAYYKLGDPEKAGGMFIEAKNQAEKLGDVPSRVGWLTAAGYIYLDVRDFQIAERSFQESLHVARQINSQEDIINSLIALAFVSEQTGRLDGAKLYADEALVKAQDDKNGRDQVYPRLVQGRVAARLHDITTAKNAFRDVAQSRDCPVFLKWEAERSLARLYEDGGRFDSADREYRTALNTFETARSELEHEDSRLPFLSNAARIYDDYIHFLVARGKTTEALQVADFSRARTLAEGLGLLSKGSAFDPQLFNAQQISRHAGGTILFYWLGEEQSYLWAITPQKVDLFRLPPAAEIKTRVDRYRKAIIEQRESTPTASDDGAALYRILVEPAKGLLPKDAKKGRVFIVPDGSLNSLNFETLLVAAKDELKGDTKEAPKPHYWIEDATLSSASSLRMLQAIHAGHGKGAGTLLLFGDAIPPNGDFPRLPKASIEMEGIKKHFSPAREQVFSRDQATPFAYLASKPERFSYIHFVAHATASRLSPLDSAIVLSPADPSAKAEGDSFKLYARDIIRHPLQAELVTVSTCRSAGARAYSGEGLVGLSWAFVRAGAHNVIGALWDVSDASTPQLMDKLYGGLKKGQTPGTALRNAKLALLRSSGSFHKPFYWAPFQLYIGP